MVRLGATNYETSWERDLDDADESLASHLYKAAALSAYLSVRGFIWELHFDTDDFVFTIPKGFGRYFDPYEEGAEVCMSSVDFARNYLSIPSNMDPQERKTFLARLRETDPILFRCYDKFRGLDREDDFLLSQAENQHVVNQHEAEAIRELRILRDFCSHFFPYYDRQEDYANVLLKHGTDQKQIVFGDYYRPAGEIAVRLAHKLITAWEDRVCPKCRQEQRQISILKNVEITSREWQSDSPPGEVYCRVAACSNPKCNEVRMHHLETTLQCDDCGEGRFVGVVLKETSASDAIFAICGKEGCGHIHKISTKAPLATDSVRKRLARYTAPEPAIWPRPLEVSSRKKVSFSEFLERLGFRASSFS